MEDIHINSLIDGLQTLLSVHGGITAIIGTFLLGENAALAIFALSAQGYINPIKAIVSVFIGSMAADSFWFFITEYVFRSHYERKFNKESKDENHQFMIRLIDKHFFWVLIFIKFLVGMRLFLTVYIVLKNRIPFFRKVLLDAVGTVLFLAVIFPVGWFFGKGVSSALSVEKRVSDILSIIVLVIAFGVILPRIITYILKRYYKV